MRSQFATALTALALSIIGVGVQVQAQTTLTARGALYAGSHSAVVKSVVDANSVDISDSQTDGQNDAFYHVAGNTRMEFASRSSGDNTYHAEGRFTLEATSLASNVVFWIQPGEV